MLLTWNSYSSLSLNALDVQGFLHRWPPESLNVPPCVERGTKAPWWRPCEGGDDEGKHLEVVASVEAASVIAAACACETESEHWSRNRKEKKLRRLLQLGEHQGEDVLHRVAPGGREREVLWHFQAMLAGAALQPVVTDNALEMMASPQQLKMTSHSHSALRKMTHLASVCCSTVATLKCDH